VIGYPSGWDGAILPAGDYPLCPQEKLPESHVINPLLTKLVRSRLLDIGLAIFCEFMDLDSISVHKHAKTNLANIQPSWSNTWSITNVYILPSCNNAAHAALNLGTSQYQWECTHQSFPWYGKTPQMKKEQLTWKMGCDQFSTAPHT